MSFVSQQIESASNKRVRWVVSAVCALLLTIVSAGAFATTVLKLDLESLVANSDQIVEGEVVETESKVEDGKVYTYTTVRVDDGLKGSEKGETVTIKQIGGRTDELATRVAGVPQFAEGERTLVFLERMKPEAPRVVTGMSQGKFKVALGPDNSTPYVVPRLGDVSLIEPIERKHGDDEQGDGDDEMLRQDELKQGNYEPARPADLYERVVPLDVFKQEVRDVVRDQEGE